MPVLDWILATDTTKALIIAHFVVHGAFILIVVPIDNTPIITNVHSYEAIEQSLSRQLRYSKCFPGNTMITIKIPDGRGSLPPGTFLEEEKYE